MVSCESPCPDDCGRQDGESQESQERRARAPPLTPLHSAADADGHCNQGHDHPEICHCRAQLPGVGCVPLDSGTDGMPEAEGGRSNDEKGEHHGCQAGADEASCRHVQGAKLAIAITGAESEPAREQDEDQAGTDQQE